MSIIMKVCWRETRLEGVLIVTWISRVPFVDTPKPSILMREVFTRVSLKGDVPIYATNSYEMMLIALPSSINTQCTRQLERIVEITRVSSCKKVIPSLSSRVKISSCH